ncbi:hypothetical protein EDF70_102134 [Neorhizobium sp. JUb45]|nr:hypothetical protein EDF70_102134 [Neorhizobium sp. JUb45]
MVYEWDAKRARRAQIGKVGLALIVACGLVAIGSWFFSAY